LPGGDTVYFTVQARNGDGIGAPFDATFFGVIPSTALPAAAAALPPGGSAAIAFQLPSGPATLLVPAGTFLVGVTITIQVPSANSVPAGTGNLSALGTPIYLQITAVDAFGAPVQPAGPVEITLSYGGGDPTDLVVARYDETHAQWVPLLTTRDAARHTLTAFSDHFSLYAILRSTPLSTLASVSVGPNPLRPTLQPGSRMTFRNLPAGARVRIFSYAGALLAELTADGSGLADWDGRNRSGRWVASGVYIALVEGAGTKRTIPVAIER